MVETPQPTETIVISISREWQRLEKISDDLSQGRVYPYQVSRELLWLIKELGADRPNVATKAIASKVVAASLHLEPSKFDVIMMRFVSRHLSREEVEQIVGRSTKWTISNYEQSGYPGYCVHRKSWLYNN